MTNALKDSASPYLRQHADNPVDWYPWGPAAFAEARRRDVPVLVSIGYATCHWCHVMAHECFENADLATLMNGHYVNIKVDREELPEVDEIYMDAVQALTGRGGWPLNAFVDHDGRPFFAGTYFPPAKWRGLLTSLSDLWVTNRSKIDEAAQELSDHLATTNGTETHGELGDLHAHLAERVEERFDDAHPGLGHAPKFPPSQLLLWLLEAGPAIDDGFARAVSILEAMQDGGIHDRIGGGFHRYSTDRVWRVPHFEKMLYDNAQLAVAFALAGAKTGRPDFARTAVHIGDYLLRDLRVVAEDGTFLGYASAEDADDSGEPSPSGCREGGFYAVESELLATIVGADAAASLIAAWDLGPGTPRVGPSGHVEPAASVIPHPRGVDLRAVASALGFESIEALRASWEAHLAPLRAARDPARRPIRDDKVLTDLNGLALMAFATLGRLAPDLGARERFTAATKELAATLISHHPDSGLLRLRGTAPRPAFVTDYGLYALGLLEAWRLLGDPSLVARAQAVVAEADARLTAPDGGYFTTPTGRADLIRRSRERGDGPYPAGQHALALANARLYAITGHESFRTRAEAVITSQRALLARAPEACPTLGLAWLELTAEATIVVVAGDGSEADAMMGWTRALPDLRTWPIAADAHRASRWPTVKGREATTPNAWVCVGTRCLFPVTTAAALAASITATRD